MIQALSNLNSGTSLYIILKEDLLPAVVGLILRKEPIQPILP